MTLPSGGMDETGLEEDVGSVSSVPMGAAFPAVAGLRSNRLQQPLLPLCPKLKKSSELTMKTDLSSASRLLPSFLIF